MEERGTELERNEFQLRIGWNGTERVPVQGWVERNGTSSIKIGTEYNTALYAKGQSGALNEQNMKANNVNIMLRECMLSVC